MQIKLFDESLQNILILQTYMLLCCNIHTKTCTWKGIDTHKNGEGAKNDKLMLIYFNKQ